MLPYSIVVLVLALVTGLTLCTFGYRWSRHDGYEDGYREGHADAQLEQLAERHEQRARARAGRHERTQPRQQPTAAAPARPGPITESPAVPRPAEGSQQPTGWYLPPPGPIRSHTSPAAIAPVILPEPGAYQPQPGRDSGPGTLTMARLDLPGEMAAITDQFIAQMAIEEEQHRLGLAT